MTQIDRRSLLRGVTLAGAAIALPSALAACGGGDTKGPAVTSGDVAIKFWTHDPSAEKLFSNAVDQLNKSGESKFDFSLDYAQQDGFTMVTKLVSTAAAGGDLPDLVGIVDLFFGPMLKDNIAQEILMDLSPAIKPLEGDLLPSYQAKYTVNGKVCGIESDTSSTVLYHRTDFVDEYGIPLDAKSWEELADFGAGLFRDHGKSLGFVGTGDSGQAFNSFLQFFSQRGGAVYDAAGNLTLGSPEAVEVLQFMMDGKESGFLLEVADPYGPSMGAALKSEKIIAVAMPDWYNQFGLQAHVPDQKGKWQIAMMPPFAGGGTRAGSLGGTGYGVVKDKPNSEAALELLKYAYLTEEGQVQRFLVGGYLPTMKSVYDNPTLTAYKDAYLGNQQVFQIYKELAPDVPPFYQSPDMPSTIDTLGTQVVNALKGRATAEQAIDAAVSTING